MIPKEKIEEVRERANIVSVISEYVPLTKRGANHIGLCPFHSEKTPSFTVSEEKKIYYCFGCNSTGNAITFVMKKDGIAFPDAVRLLARRYGVVISDEKKGPSGPQDLMLAALKTASEYFEKALAGPAGKPARDYLEKRGYKGDILRQFGVGFAPNAWEGLAGYLKAKGVSADAAEKAGLIVKKEKGFYDRFRSRVMFPITDPRGRVIGFGGRSLDDAGDAGPKYLNSPESALFKKGTVFFGFYQAKEGIRKEGSAIIVEGYFDLMALHKNGFTNSVATMGTALTAEHIRALKGYAGAVYSLFDSDQAGRNAALRGLPLFLEEEMPCRAVILPTGKDPDEFLAASGAAAMKGAIEKAEPLMEFYLTDLRKKLNFDTPEGKAKYLDGAVEYLSKVRNIAERGHYIAIMASTLGIAAGSIYEALKAPASPGSKSPGGVKEAAGTHALSRNTRLKELTILKVILKHPELYCAEIEEAVPLFSDPVLKAAGSLISSFCKGGRPLDPAAMLEDVADEEMRGRIAGFLFKEEDGFVEHPERMLEDSLKSLLNKGKIKCATRDIIRQLEDAGRPEAASDMKKRVGAASSGKIK